MAYGLYKFELQEHIDYWYQELLRDKDEFVFAVTENNSDVAMVLIMSDFSIRNIQYLSVILMATDYQYDTFK